MQTVDYIGVLQANLCTTPDFIRLRQRGDAVPILDVPPPILLPEETSALRAPIVRNNTLRNRLAAHLSLLRLDHSVKQIFVIPGIVVAVSITQSSVDAQMLMRAALGFVAVILAASSNYVLNELLDAPFDRHIPAKSSRPAACGRVNVRVGYAQWLICGFASFAVAGAVSKELFFSVLALWVMGCLYNVPPIRTKDIPYLDVLSESINNPIRFCVGWYIVTSTILPPASLLLAYWLLGAYFMALKRFSEYRQIGGRLASRYRRSFAFYTEQALLTCVTFYAAAAMLFFGAFIMRYRMEMVFAFPFIALLMALYFQLAFVENSPVQNPEKLYREPRLMALLALCCIVFVATSFVRIPWLHRMFPRSGAHHPRTHETLLDDGSTQPNH
jgi:decaprenyl-phosphate phosphoribosyltransferase